MDLSIEYLREAEIIMDWLTEHWGLSGEIIPYENTTRSSFEIGQTLTFRGTKDSLLLVGDYGDDSWKLMGEICIQGKLCLRFSFIQSNIEALIDKLERINVALPLVRETLEVVESSVPNIATISPNGVRKNLPIITFQETVWGSLRQFILPHFLWRSYVVEFGFKFSEGVIFVRNVRTDETIDLSEYVTLRDVILVLS